LIQIETIITTEATFTASKKSTKGNYAVLTKGFNNATKAKEKKDGQSEPAAPDKYVNLVSIKVTDENRSWRKLTNCNGIY
jgi:hypothetical protein